ncbi:hypothetical protein [Streptosporangium carneum]|uniref:Uncharacterized protein n=1 Tax=Streptosporangium carneum TaxID=47481 RepID=A0A9W6I6G0_9ACTN|nr:hypothetical protein [Streptosporangium carneum]GLK11810.1 hypothetical protein GCM10017600_52180 [Streptosporangium carneum]
MGFPGEPPRRQPYVQPDGQVPPAQGERWFDSAAQGHTPQAQGSFPASAPYGHSPQPQGSFESAPYGHSPQAQGSFPGSAQHGRPPQERGSFESAPYGRAPESAAPGRAADPSEAARPPAPPEEPRRAMWSPYDEGPRSRRPLLIVAGALGVLVAAGFGLAALVKSEGSSPSGTASAPAQASAPPVVPQSPGGKFGFAASRATDPHPLTLGEMFKRKKVSYKGQSYLMTVRRTDKKCKDAVVGDKLQKALASGKCTQLLRASFRDASGKIIGTVGVANLKTSAAAAKVVSAGAGKSRKEYLKALPGKDKVTKSLGSGEAFAGGWRHGHYVVMVWFQYKDGHLPKKSEVKQLNQAAFGAVDATVTPALESRSLTGKRP